jgi:hypothetical protein
VRPEQRRTRIEWVHQVQTQRCGTAPTAQDTCGTSRLQKTFWSSDVNNMFNIPLLIDMMKIIVPLILVS